MLDYLNGEIQVINGNSAKLVYKLFSNLNTNETIQVSVEYKYSEEDNWKKITKYTNWYGTQVNQVFNIPVGNTNKIFIKNLKSESIISDLSINSQVINIIENNEQTTPIINNYVTYSYLESVVSNIGSSYNSEQLWEIGSGSYSIQLKKSGSIALGDYSVAEGHNTWTIEEETHAEGHNSYAYGGTSHAEGESTYSFGPNSHVEGFYSIAYGNASHAEGAYTYSGQQNSHAEGQLTYSLGYGSHSEGSFTYAYGHSAHSEGYESFAYSDYSHTEGWHTLAYGFVSHAEGSYTTTYGDKSHAEGLGTGTLNIGEHAEGIYNLPNENTISTIGIGYLDETLDKEIRRNAFEVHKNGDIYIYGIGNYDGTNSNNANSIKNELNKFATQSYIQEKINNINPISYNITYTSDEGITEITYQINNSNSLNNEYLIDYLNYNIPFNINIEDIELNSLVENNKSILFKITPILLYNSEKMTDEFSDIILEKNNIIIGGTVFNNIAYQSNSKEISYSFNNITPLDTYVFNSELEYYYDLGGMGTNLYFDDTSIECKDNDLSLYIGFRNTYIYSYGYSYSYYQDGHLFRENNSYILDISYSYSGLKMNINDNNLYITGIFKIKNNNFPNNSHTFNDIFGGGFSINKPLVSYFNENNILDLCDYSLNDFNNIKSSIINEYNNINLWIKPFNQYKKLQSNEVNQYILNMENIHTFFN